MEGEATAPKAPNTPEANEAEDKGQSIVPLPEQQAAAPEHKTEEMLVESGKKEPQAAIPEPKAEGMLVENEGKALEAEPVVQTMDVDKGSDTTEKLDEDVAMAENEAPLPHIQAETDSKPLTEESKTTVSALDEPKSVAFTLDESSHTEPVSVPEESKEPAAIVHHPVSEGFTCVVDQHISPDGKKVPIEPLKSAISQLRSEGKSWTDVLGAVFGYRYDEEWKLKKISKDEGFTFVEQKHYELLGDVILSYVQEVMRVKYLQKEVLIPEMPAEGPKCNIFLSQDFFTNSDRCLLLIQGAGAVRAGQWARSVCINAKLTEGTVFPALDFAQTHGFSTITFNPNMNYLENKPIPGSHSMEVHSLFVWKNYIRRSPATSLFIIAHSCGGMCTTELLRGYETEFIERVKAVAFTDSVHGGVHGSSAAKKHLGKVSVDFVASHLPLKAPVRTLEGSYNGCVCVSSGHNKHEYTTGSAMPAIVEFFETMLETGKNMFLKQT